jgi:hypothetical protein
MFSGVTGAWKNGTLCQDSGHHLHLATAALAGFQVELEDPLQPLRPAQDPVALRRVVRSEEIDQALLPKCAGGSRPLHLTHPAAI